MPVFYYLLVLTALVILLLRIKSINKELYLFIPLLLLSLLVEGARVFSIHNNAVSNFLFSVYTPVEYTILSIFTARILVNNSQKKIIYWSIPPFVITSVAVQFFLNSNNAFIKYLDVLIEAPLIIIGALFYIFQLFTDEKTFRFKDNDYFWISVGNLLFFAASFFSYGFGSYLQNYKEYILADSVFWIARILNIILYIFYITGFICSNRKKSYLW